MPRSHASELIGHFDPDAVKQQVVSRILRAMAQQRISRSELARRMHTIRSLVSRTLDPAYESSISTLMAAAAAVGKQLHLVLHDAMPSRSTALKSSVRAAPRSPT